MTRSIISMKYEIESINKRLDINQSLLESINNKLNYTSTSTINVTCEKYENDLICINNNTNLEKMEDMLTNNREFRGFVVIVCFKFIM